MAEGETPNQWNIIWGPETDPDVYRALVSYENDISKQRETNERLRALCWHNWFATETKINDSLTSPKTQK